MQAPAPATAGRPAAVSPAARRSRGASATPGRIAAPTSWTLGALLGAPRQPGQMAPLWPLGRRGFAPGASSAPGPCQYSVCGPTRASCGPADTALPAAPPSASRRQAGVLLHPCPQHAPHARQRGRSRPQWRIRLHPTPLHSETPRPLPCSGLSTPPAGAPPTWCCGAAAPLFFVPGPLASEGCASLLSLSSRARAAPALGHGWRPPWRQRTPLFLPAAGTALP